MVVSLVDGLRDNMNVGRRTRGRNGRGEEEDTEVQENGI